MKSRWLALVVALSLVAALVAVLASAFGSDPREVPFGLKGHAAPAFSIRDLATGKPVSLADFPGKPAVLNFWATWCGPCKLEHPVIEWGARRYHGRVAFLGLVFEDSEENTRRFLAENPSSYPQLYDPKSTVAVDFAVAGVPETYFISRTGTIVEKVAHPLTRDELVAEVERLLQ